MVVMPSIARETLTGEKQQIWEVVGHVCTVRNQHTHHGFTAWDVDPPMLNVPLKLFGRRYTADFTCFLDSQLLPMPDDESQDAAPRVAELQHG